MLANTHFTALAPITEGRWSYIAISTPENNRYSIGSQLPWWSDLKLFLNKGGLRQRYKQTLQFLRDTCPV